MCSFVCRREDGFPLTRTKLEMRNISIEFPGVKALDSVDFTTETGTVHALIGANGAGKSTLMKVLSGAYNHFTGNIYMNGKEVHIRSPRDAQEHGIQIVYQEVDTALVPYLTVGENIMLNKTVNDMGSKQFVDWGTIHKEASSILESMNVDIPTRKLVSELTLAEKQMVLIARALSKECKFLILDEPTAPLSNAETLELFRIVKDLKEKNVGIIFISHRLAELFQICDEITVMRNGRFIIKEQIKNTTQNKIIEHMLGRKLDHQFPKIEVEIGEPIFEVHNLKDHEKLNNINFYIREGEIVGIAGLVGAGKTELSKALFGASKIEEGEIILRGKRLNLRNPYDAVKAGIALVPEERRKEGVLVQESVLKNLTIANLKQYTKRFSFMNFKKEKEDANLMINNLGIKTPSANTLVQNLSGGNQQKVAIGKWLLSHSNVFIFDEPTKGVDVGAKKDIYELIMELAKNKKGILYLTSEFPEILGITDRVYVIYDGEIVKEFNTKETTEEELLFYSTGGK
mgnify:FL=1